MNHKKENQQFLHVKHEFDPIYNKESRILILGTFPSVKSREQQFYYGHPQNRFWQVLAGLFGESVLESIHEKKEFLLKHHIAIWDVIAECDIYGSSDSSIKNVVPTDLSVILRNAPIEKIYANGTKAYELYMKYSYPISGMEITKLPSTSPANATYGMERLMDEWGQIKITADIARINKINTSQIWMPSKDLVSFYKSIVDQDRSAVVICDLEHTIIYMNPAAVKNYEKYGGDELVGRSLLECHNRVSVEKIRQVVDWFMADENHNIVYTFHNEKQNKDVYMVALRDEGKLIGYYEKHEYRNRESMSLYDLW